MNQSVTTDSIDAALQFIPADDRGVWVTIGMAIKSEFGDAGYGIWDYWSQTGQSYNERDGQAVWRSFRDGGIKVASLFHIAREHGYQPDKSAPPRTTPVKKAPPPKTDTGAYAAAIWLRANDDVAAHPYAIAKGITWAAGTGRASVTGKVVGKAADCIVVPIRDLASNKVVAVQCINAEGAKQTFGSLSGNGFVCGNTMDLRLRWFVVEGWADAVSMVFHHYDGDAVAFAACGKSGMDRLAVRVAEVYQPEQVIIMEDAA